MILFASDFDGTMHFRDNRGWGYIPKKNTAAVKEFRNKGNLFGFCTGRPLEGLLRDLDDTLPTDYVISSTGSVITKGKSMEDILSIHQIQSETVRRIVDAYSHDYDLIFHAVTAVYTVDMISTSYREQKVLSEAELLQKNISGISVYCETNARAEALANEINAQYKDLNAYQNRDWLDIVAAGVSKGNALLQAKKLFHADICAAIGDAENDISMLKAADISFTFHSSRPIVRAAADHLVDSVAEAIAYLMEHETN